MSYYIDKDSGEFVVWHSGPHIHYIQSKHATFELAQAHIHYLNGGDGLTKRERFAMAAMQGIQASLSSSDNMTVGNITDLSIKQADSLIKGLEGEG